MASYNGEARVARPLHLSWSAVFGGGLIGWGTLFLLSLVGASLVEGRGSAAFGEHLARIGLGLGVWGVVAMLVASFVGAFFVVRIAGERRRREGLLHGAVSWGLSAAALALLALVALGGASTSSPRATPRAATKAPAAARLTVREQAALEDRGGQAAKAAGATAGALGLSLGLALLGAVIACATLSGARVTDQLRSGLRRRDLDDLGPPTILPPVH
jgi:hypothetical protein